MVGPGPAGRGIKFDKDKPDLSLCPLSALELMAWAFMDGLIKYGRHQYKEGMESHRLVAAAQRHLLKWEQGEEHATDSGVHHLGGALASIAMLAELQRLGKLVDTRHKERTEEQLTQACLDDMQLAVEDLCTPPAKTHTYSTTTFCTGPGGVTTYQQEQDLTDSEVQRLFWEGL